MVDTSYVPRTSGLTPRDPLVAIAGLRVVFETHSGPIAGVRDVSFNISPGECLCVVGESGSGKSVSALSLMRLVEFGGGRIAAGELRFRQADGRVIDLAQTDQARMRAIRGGQIGMIFQEPMTALNPVFTIERQLTEVILTHRLIPTAAARARALELLTEMQISEPERRLKQYPHELSGGMRQRVVIAMAMACEPRLLICDEPTTALDVTVQAEILALIDRLKRATGTAVLFITHDMAVVAQMADRVVVMYRGEKVEEGPVEAIFSDPQQSYTRALLAAVPRLGEMRGTTLPAPMRGLATGDQSSAATPRPVATPAAAADAPLLDVRHLCTRFPVRKGLLRRTIANVHAVEDVSFTINPGQTLSLVGESGCGKSTCGRSILRLIQPLSGEVMLETQDVLAQSSQGMHALRRKMQMIFQDPYASLNPRMRLFDQVAEPLVNYTRMSGQALHRRVAELFDRVRLPAAFIDLYPHELSGGQRQRVAIARALALEPKLIIADEAVSALDVSVQAQVLNLLMELQADLGIACLFISHDMSVVERISHRVAVMYLGRIVEIGPRAAIFEAPQHPYTRALLAAVPIADPSRRKAHSLTGHPVLRSPIHPADYVPPPSLYTEVAPGHLVLQMPADVPLAP
ncbi:ABC transporter ATP-binding protein [Chelatococcus asaccharovorans]|uniref:ABC transporter ATP-binding protein n=1 Tax=Chelatococcus asaccharovorans TaxID=28210 RepID=UPI00224C7120|nr:ABC transporter ATP-binding protein [Chelatococcus asaccharovorans]CAH1663661.1 glutathione ABC transporter ATP binding subunit GsiA [Chelatococcus asaccharovorans]CAH1682702.1 glutathione ABC transporter ATP binding subunit GsiA [Chelatococcus asaccharovorans]